MQKIVTIGGKEIPMRSSGASPVKYKIIFNRDLYVDLQPILKGMKKKADGSAYMPMEAIDVFTRMGYVFATQADPELLKTSFEDWLDQFELMDLTAGFEQIVELWNMENTTTANLKKKNGK